MRFINRIIFQFYDKTYQTPRRAIMGENVRIGYKGRLYTSYKEFYYANEKDATVKYLNFMQRIKKGMSPIEALTKPTKK